VLLEVQFIVGANADSDSGESLVCLRARCPLAVSQLPQAMCDCVPDLFHPLVPLPTGLHLVPVLQSVSDSLPRAGRIAKRIVEDCSARTARGRIDRRPRQTLQPLYAERLSHRHEPKDGGLPVGVVRIVNRCAESGDMVASYQSGGLPLMLSKRPL